MNILFVFSNLEANCGANMNIGLTLAKRMSSEHRVSAIVGIEKGEIDRDKTTIFENIYPVEILEDVLLNNFLESNSWGERSAISRAVLMVGHFSELRRYIDVRRHTYCEKSRILAEKIEDVCAGENFDAVIGIVYPYFVAAAFSEARIKPKKFILQLDPFYSSMLSIKPSKRKRKQMERKTSANVDNIFTTQFIIDEAPYKREGQYVTIDFPEIIVGRKYEATGAMPSERVNCTYVGSFYDDIRSPKYLLELFLRLPENYILNIIGSGCESTFEEYRELLGDRLILHGSKSREEADEFRNHADVLVNVSNAVPNQVSSKLFEYFETGKPMINICKLDDCPSTKYTDIYPNAINVYEREDPAEAAKRVAAFISEKNGTIVDHDEVERIFYKNTDAYVCEQILKEI